MPSIPEFFRSSFRTVRGGARVLLAGLLLVALTAGVLLSVNQPIEAAKQSGSQGNSGNSVPSDISQASGNNGNTGSGSKGTGSQKGNEGAGPNGNQGNSGNEGTGKNGKQGTGDNGNQGNHSTGNNQNGQKGISLQPAPTSRSVTQGGTASYNVVVKATGGFTGSVSLSVSGLPANTSASFSPTTVTIGPGASPVDLNVSATSSTAPGTFSLSLKGSSGTVQSAVVVVSLTVTAVQHQPFSISGGPTGLLGPGYTVPIDLQLANPNNVSLSVTNLIVFITGITRTAEAVANNRPCNPSDYAVTQFSGSYPFIAPPGRSSLSGRGVPAAQWPQIKMLNTSLNQDGCKGATLQLSYSGSGQGN
ncbi:hypothetical protein ABH924_002641 [Arthrobacter sp. GAS37]|uniref:COG1470 family protein n=1 Tax=Arthrobacter sp. GAS37 TaxID=3156261 RepID=UPI00383254ED